MKTRKTSNRITFQSLTAAVCVCVLLLGLIPTAAAAETQSAETAAADSSGVTAAEATDVSSEASAEENLLAYLRGEIAAYMETYQLTADMPDQALANAYLTLDSKASKAAWDTANELLSLAGNLSTEDAETLLAETNTKLCLRFYNVMEQIVESVPMVVAINGEPADGLNASGGSTFTWNVTDSEISVTATPLEETSGCDTTYSAQSDTLTLTAGVEGTLKISYTINGTATVLINEASPSNEYSLQVNGEVQIKVTSGSAESDSGTVTFTYYFTPSGEDVTISFQPVASIPYKVNDSTNVNTEAQSVSGDPAAGFEIKANSANYVLTGATLEAEDGTTTTLPAIGGKVSPTVSGKLTPIFAYDSDGDGTAPYLVGTTTYWDWDEAMTAAASGDKLVILNDDHTLAARDKAYNIPSGITLLIPYDAAGTLITNNMEDYVSTSSTVGSEYRRLTMPSGASIAVEGALCIGSQAARLMVGQVGPYGAIALDSGSNITINSGANLYAYGYIFYGKDGGGTVTVESGGTVYESAFIRDYPGNSENTQGLYEGGVFPMRAYTIRNVEVPMTLKAGATEYAFYSLYGSIIGTYPGYFMFVGNSDTAPFQLDTGTTFTKAYSGGKQTMDINGSLTLNSLNMTLKVSIFGDFPVSSSTTAGFPLPSGYDVNLTGGTLKLNDNFLMMEGSKITVAQGATIDTNGKKIYVLDATEDTGTVNVQDVHDTSYTLVDSDAVLDVNGTINVSGGGLYTSESHAQIISSDGTGQIVFTGASVDQTSVRIRVGGIAGLDSGSKTLQMNSAYLLNSDDTYTNTGAGGTTNTYTYIDGFWRCGTHSYTSVTVEPTCTDAGSTTYTCSVCGHSYSEPIAATGHSYTPVVTDPTCTEQGYTTYTCACGDSYVSDITASLGHEWQEDGTCVRDCVAIASVNGQMYLSVAEALEAVPVGGTIKLLYAPAATDTPAFNKSVTVNKNGLDYEIVCADGWDDVDNGDDTWTVQKVSDGDKFHIYAANVNMGNNLDMLFAIPKDAVTDWTGHYVQIVRTGSAEASEDETVDVKFAEWVENGSFYIITYGGFDAKEMCDSITLTVYNSEGTAVSYPWTDSIRAYAMRILGISDDDRQKTVAVDMLNFGAEAQKHLNYGTEKLANALLSDAQKALASGGNPVSDDLDEGSNFEGGNLIVTSHIQYALVFKGQTSEMTAKIEYTGHKGNTFSEIVTISNLNGTECFVVPGFVVADARYPITITVYNEDDSEYTTCVDSIEAYISRKAADSPVFAAFMKFADSAHAFKHEGKYE